MSGTVGLGLILYFFSGTIYVMKGYNQYQFPMLLAAIAIIMFCNFRQMRFICKPYGGAERSFVAFSVCIAISAITNGNISIIISSLGMMLLWLVCGVWLPQSYDTYKHSLSKVHYYVLMPYFLLMAYSLIYRPISLVRYSGVFRTTNGLGDAAATACAVCLSILLYDSFSSKSLLKKTINIGLTAVTVFFALISTCRGAVITVGILLLAFVVIKANYSLSQERFAQFICGLFFAIIIILLVVKFTSVGSAVTSVIEKFSSKSENILDGRNDRWDIIFSRIKLFGNGEEIDLAAHNTFFSMLDQYGVFAFGFSVLFAVLGIVASWRIAVNKNIESKVKFLPFFSFLAFFAMSLTEGMMLKTVMLICVFCFPLLDENFYYSYMDNEQDWV